MGVTKGATMEYYPVVIVPASFDYSFIPSGRPLHAILVKVVKHGLDFPTHGVDCACMDQFMYEVRQHIARAVPEAAKILFERDPFDPDPGWTYAPGERERQLDAQWRIKYVLRAAVRYL